MYLFLKFLAHLENHWRKYCKCNVKEINPNLLELESSNLIKYLHHKSITLFNKFLNLQINFL